MPRWTSLLFVLGVAPVLGVACGVPSPSEADIFYDPALRASTVEATDDSERELLRALRGGGDSVAVGGRTYSLEPSYAAASGRRCQAIVGAGGRRVACETDGEWTFVPDVIGREAGADGERTSGGSTSGGSEPGLPDTIDTTATEPRAEGS